MSSESRSVAPRMAAAGAVPSGAGRAPGVGGSRGDADIDEICVVALAEAFRGDGEVLCNPMGPVPVIAGRLARAVFEPELMLTDTIAYAVKGTPALGAGSGAGSDVVIESYLPFRTIFDLMWSGRRHVVMGAGQIDRFGNQNFAAIGDYRRPKAQLLGMRGAPGNLINHTTSYWVPGQARSFSSSVDVVSGPGYDRVAALPEPSRRFHEIRRVVTELGSYDFETPDHSMRLRSVHPGVGIAEIVAATPFELVIDDDVEESRLPTATELELIRTVIDPQGLRKAGFS